MLLQDEILLRKRVLVESVNDELKQFVRLNIQGIAV